MYRNNSILKSDLQVQSLSIANSVNAKNKVGFPDERMVISNIIILV